jgi:FkbM family methyltransferase
MTKVSSYIRELKQAKKITQNVEDFLKLVLFTVLYHLGNKWRFFNSNDYRRLRCVCNGRNVTVELRQNSGDIFTLYEALGTVPYRFQYPPFSQVHTIVDLGAHIGLASLYFAILFPEARLFSIEPALDNFELLKKNCEINGIHSTLVNKCIGSKKGTVRIYLNEFSNMHSLHGGASRGEIKSFMEIEMITMNDLIAENDIDEIDILKVDI